MDQKATIKFTHNGKEYMGNFAPVSMQDELDAQVWFFDGKIFTEHADYFRDLSFMVLINII